MFQILISFKDSQNKAALTYKTVEAKDGAMRNLIDRWGTQNAFVSQKDDFGTEIRCPSEYIESIICNDVAQQQDLKFEHAVILAKANDAIDSKIQADPTLALMMKRNMPPMGNGSQPIFNGKLMQ